MKPLQSGPKARDLYESVTVFRGVNVVAFSSREPLPTPLQQGRLIYDHRSPALKKITRLFPHPTILSKMSGIRILGISSAG